MKKNMDIEKILTEGNCSEVGSLLTEKERKVKTKAKKKTYITGLHGSGSAKDESGISPPRAK